MKAYFLRLQSIETNKPDVQAVLAGLRLQDEYHRQGTYS